MKYKDLPTSQFKEKYPEYDLRLKEFYHFSELLPILSKYTCPLSCTQCCKTLNPTVSVLDIHKIQTSHPLTTNLCSNLQVSPQITISLGSPCAFLSTICSIYHHRPHACQIYPFVFRESLPDHIQLMPCPLGIQIINDLFPRIISIYTDLHTSSGSSPQTISTFLKDSAKLQKTLNDFHLSGKYFHLSHNSHLPCLQIQKSILSQL